MPRSPPPPPPYAQQQPKSTLAMTETQSAPFPPPPMRDSEFAYRRLPQPVQLPPLTIPPPVRHDFQYGPPIQSLPSIQSASAFQSQPQRSYPARAAPLDKLLSPHPFTPPQSDPAYSPQYESRRSPPRSAIESRLPPRNYSEFVPESRPAQVDSSFTSPVDQPYRQSYVLLPSPSHTSSYTASNHSYRESIGSHRGSNSSALIPSSYTETGHPPPAALPEPTNRLTRYEQL